MGRRPKVSELRAATVGLLAGYHRKLTRVSGAGSGVLRDGKGPNHLEAIDPTPDQFLWLAPEIGRPALPDMRPVLPAMAIPALNTEAVVSSMFAKNLIRLAKAD